MKTKVDKGKYKIFAVIIAVALLISFIRLYWEESPDIYAPECKMEYGYGECIDGFLTIPFYNPNTRDVTFIRITVPFGIETNITLPADFNVWSPLKSGKTDVLKLVPCKKDIDISGFAMEWCCSSDCYKTKMNRPTEEIYLGEG
jgi:hypothetical protein